MYGSGTAVIVAFTNQPTSIYDRIAQESMSFMRIIIISGIVRDVDGKEDIPKWGIDSVLTSFASFSLNIPIRPCSAHSVVGPEGRRFNCSGICLIESTKA